MMKDAMRTAIALLASAGAVSAQTPAGNEFLVNTYTFANQFAPDVAMEADGDFVVVWSSDFQSGGGDGIFGQRFAATGVARGGEFPVASFTQGRQVVPSVAVGSRGDFVVAWQGEQDGSLASIQGQRFDAAGSAIGVEFAVNTFTTGNQYRPRVGQAPDGRVVVLWSSWEADGSDYAVAGRRFDAAGNPVGGEFLVNTYTTGQQRFPDLAFDAGGQLLTVWEGSRDGGFNTNIFGQRYDADFSPVGAEFQVNSSTTGHHRAPSVSVSPAGGFVVSWTSNLAEDGDGYGISARRFDADANALGTDFVVNTYTTGYQFYGQVASDAKGNFVISWYGPGDGNGFGTFGQRFTAAGDRRGSEFQINTYTTGSGFRPVAASDSVGNFVVAWDQDGSQDGSGYGVFARRFGGLTPAALSVDSANNPVLEPGETVVVRPTWRNFNGAAQTFGGALTDISGPAGATYAITDGAADYGTVGDGATAACVECYAVSVSNPATRPAVHWDASAIESIVPDAQGQQKQWLLHVGGSFTDVAPANPFYRFIETLLHHGVTSGCNATAYCPGADTTRDQMAVFVLVAKEGAGYVPPACTTPMFADVPASNPFCRWIEELARRAVVNGCGGGNYCPTSAVTREQMAVFVLRTLDPALSPPACGTPVYGDVPASNGFCRWIEELTRRNVVTGCGNGNYCPSAAVTREQMGVFISATFGLTLYGL